MIDNEKIFLQEKIHWVILVKIIMIEWMSSKYEHINKSNKEQIWMQWNVVGNYVSMGQLYVVTCWCFQTREALCSSFRSDKYRTIRCKIFTLEFPVG